MIYTKEFVKTQLTTNLAWIERALVVLYARQTSDEQLTHYTQADNSRGFNKPDARYLSYCAKWVMSGKHLNEKHATKCATKLPKYWSQILEEITLRTAA